VTKQELNLLKLASGGSTKPGAASAQIARRELAYAVAPGGMALWVCLRMSVNVDAWARRLIQHGVSWYTGRRYAFDGKSKPFGRLSFAWLNERELTEAVQRMAAARL